MTTKALATTESQLAAPQPTVAGMLQAIIDKGVTTENVAAMEQLVGLYERMEARGAERAFNEAMVQLKNSMPPILACKPVLNNDKTLRYKYAPLEEIDDKLKSAALDHGFTYSFAEAAAPEGRVTKVCVVRHIGGHTERTPFTVRVGKGPPGSSEAQGDGAAATYAQRRALCDAFGIIVEADTDGASDSPRDEGRPISQEQAASFKSRARVLGMTQGEVRALLDWAGVDVKVDGLSFEKIMSTRHADVDGELREREQEQAKKDTAPKGDEPEIGW